MKRVIRQATAAESFSIKVDIYYSEVSDDVVATDTSVVMKALTTEQTQRSNHQEEQKTYRPQKELFPAALRVELPLIRSPIF